MSTNEENSKFVQTLIAEKARLEAEKQALIEEFRSAVPVEWSPEDLKEKLRDLTAKAYARISQTIDNDDEPALAFQAAKYVFSYSTGAVPITDRNDPNNELNELLKNLKPRGHDNDTSVSNETPSATTES